MDTARGSRWNILLFGSPFPTRTRRVTTYGLFVLLLLAIYGTRASFLPSEWWSSAGLIVTHVATVVAVGLTWWGIKTGALPINSAAVDRRRKVWGIIALPFLLWFVFWGSLTRAIPDLITLTMGSPGSASLTLRKEHTYSRRSCNNKVRGDRLSNHFPGFLCLSPMEYGSLPDNGPMVLVGPETPFGMHVSEISRP